MTTDWVDTAVHPVINVEMIGTAMWTWVGYAIVQPNSRIDAHWIKENRGTRRRRAFSIGKTASEWVVGLLPSCVPGELISTDEESQ